MKPKRRECPPEVDAFLTERGWKELADGRWTHPSCAFPWPCADADRLERESGVPLSRRKNPFAPRAFVTIKLTHNEGGTGTA